MVDIVKFVSTLKSAGIDFFTGVPDSLLKSFCAYIQDTEDNEHNIIAANEGAALGLAAGHYLSTKNVACVYMQNSGIGNAVNPLLSLLDEDVYKIPALILIGWRGEPGTKDEPQHKKQGKVTIPLIESMGIPYTILSDDTETALTEISKICVEIKKTCLPYAVVIRKGTFDTYSLKKVSNEPSSLGREDAISTILDIMPKSSVVVSTTGMISRELFELRELRKESHEKDFLTVGSMGHASQIALGIALGAKEKTVFCFDGDGATLMHMGSLAIIGQLSPNNLFHIVFNNGAHDSVGGQPTVALNINLPMIAKSVGYKRVYVVDDSENLENVIQNITQLSGPVFIEVRVKKGARANLGRPTSTPVQNKDELMNYISANK